MDELFKALKHFITRDVIFVLGGSSIIASFLYLFDRLDVTNVSSVLYLLGAGFAYVVGYTVQDLFALTPVITVRYPMRPGRIVRGLYKLFERTAWQDIPEFDSYKATILIDGKASEREIAHFERTIALKQVGTTMGPCFIVSAIPLVLRAIRTHETFDTTLAILLPILGVVLILLAWIKTAQTTQHMYALYTSLSTATENKGATNEKELVVSPSGHEMTRDTP